MNSIKGTFRDGTNEIKTDRKLILILSSTDSFDLNISNSPKQNEVYEFPPQISMESYRW